MFEIAGGVIIGGIGLAVLYSLFLLLINGQSRPQLGKGLAAGLRGFIEGMKGVTDEKPKR